MKLGEFLDGVSKVRVKICHIHNGKQVLMVTSVLDFAFVYKSRDMIYGNLAGASVSVPLDVEVDKFARTRIGGRSRKSAVVNMGKLMMTIDPLAFFDRGEEKNERDTSTIRAL